MPRYNPAVIEPKWQEFWESYETFRAADLPVGEKMYVLDMFPYPSGDGLHVGHLEGYSATDIVCRFERMRGKHVLHPMGFDAFGLPAEEHAIKTNTPPRESTEKNILNFIRQLKMMGFSYDWNRMLATTDVEYFRWTQWILLLLHDTWFDAEQGKGRPIVELPIPDDVTAQGEAAVVEYRDDHRLAFQSYAMVNWCTALGTVLANEEVIDGKSERGGHPVSRIPLRQWMLRITAYADRLENDLTNVDWSDGIKNQQIEWIGRSEGAEVDFFIGEAGSFEPWRESRKSNGFPRKPQDDSLRVYTTRPDTLFGATYMVVAPEHPAVAQLTTDGQQAEVEAYCQKAMAKSDRERMEVDRDKTKTGVFSGSYAINPVNGAKTPVWIADYVLISYGSGAIMAVPAHDTRDFEFAEQYGIPIIAVVDPGEKSDVDREAVLSGSECFAGQGVAVNSGSYDGQTTDEFKSQITSELAERGMGRQAVNYKLRDWLFCRQRFWGEPFPILHELDDEGKPTGVVIGVEQSELPVDLPHLDDYKPHGRPEPPLEKAPQDWLHVELNGKRYKRETNTMPQWAGSCWYYLRFIDPKNGEVFVDTEKEKAWMPVDLYVGGAEHAVLHLLYARFWHKVLFDRGHVSTSEPFQRLVNQGMILGDVEYTGFKNEAGEWVSAKEAKKNEAGDWARRSNPEQLLFEQQLEVSQLKKKGESFVLVDDDSIRIDSRAHKMSKSRGNVVNPDELIAEYGADSLRLYEMFMGPLEAPKPWSMESVSGVRGFLDRVWRMVVDDRAEELKLNDAVQDSPPTDSQNRILHRTIEKVTNDTASLSFNTAIARMMEFVNHFTKESVRPKSAMEKFVLLLSPYAPHLCEELWQLLGREGTLAYELWPEFDEAFLSDDQIEIPIQLNGKLRSRISVSPDASKADLEAAALANEEVAAMLDGKTVIKTIVVPKRMVNFVVK